MLMAGRESEERAGAAFRADPAQQETAMDALVERLSRAVAQRTSRRGFLGYLGKALVGGMMIPLLPINRVVEQAQAAMGAEGSAEGDGGDLTSCDYWRYCGFDGYLCSCCGGALTSCPPGTVASPTSWVGTCQHPSDGKEYIIAYRDCCGKDVCNRCFCDNNKGQVPIYRPQLDNDIIWCFGAKNFAYHCTTAIRLGAKT
jgi:methylamine dehydrogenase light chain